MAPSLARLLNDAPEFNDSRARMGDRKQPIPPPPDAVKPLPPPAPPPKTQPSCSESERESAPFVITQLQILMMASACLSAQEIADCLDRDGVPTALSPSEVVRHEQ